MAGEGQSEHVSRVDGWVVWHGCSWKAPDWPGFTQPAHDKCSLMYFFFFLKCLDLVIRELYKWPRPTDRHTGHY